MFSAIEPMSRRAFGCRIVLVFSFVGLSMAESGVPVAIKGYDAAAHFTLGQPTPGSPDISYESDGMRWRFADATNRTLFERDPQAYAPQDGGDCALEMTTGNRGLANPEVWAIVDGKLYCNYDKETREEWQQDTGANIARADTMWAEQPR